MSWHWQLPDAPLRSRVLALIVVGSIGAAGAGAAAASALALGAAYPAKAAVVFAVIGLTAIGGLRSHHPSRTFGAANLVTTVRVWLLALITALLGESTDVGNAGFAAALTVVAVLLDGLDGWVARRSNITSVFGARYDMEVDALLILVLSVLVWQFGKAGAWIILAGCMRYLFVLAAYVWHWLEAPLPPSRRRQAMCVVQVVGLGVVLSPLLGGVAAVGVAAATLASLVYSFMVDIVWLRRRHA